MVRLVMHSLPVPVSRLYIFLAETRLSSFDLLWVQVVGACFALLPPPTPTLLRCEC